MEDLALYLYGFVRSSTALPVLEGVEPGVVVFPVACGELACAASFVPAGEYRESAQARGEEWLAPRALRHHEVLSALHGITTVLPLRFGALCNRENDVRSLLVDRGAALLTALRTLDGKDEWTLRMSADTEAIAARCERESPALAALAEEAAGVSEGRAYFLRKQRANSAAVLLSQALAALEDSVLDRLAALTLPVVRGRRELARGTAEAALLVSRDDLHLVKTAVAALEDEHAWCGLRFSLVGPWPPYSFAPSLGAN